jgi:hypothetical protein
MSKGERNWDHDDRGSMHVSINDKGGDGLPSNGGIPFGIFSSISS